VTDERAICGFATMLGRYVQACASSGPDGQWPGGPHPAWTTAALMAARRPEAWPAVHDDALPDAFWTACGFAHRPDDDALTAGVTGAARALTVHGTLPGALAALREVLRARGEWQLHREPAGRGRRSVGSV
jgi:hypothetical protein